jgi:hypothetical protein
LFAHYVGAANRTAYYRFIKDHPKPRWLVSFDDVAVSSYAEIHSAVDLLGREVRMRSMKYRTGILLSLEKTRDDLYFKRPNRSRCGLKTDKSFDVALVISVPPALGPSLTSDVHQRL